MPGVSGEGSWYMVNTATETTSEVEQKAKEFTDQVKEAAGGLKGATLVAAETLTLVLVVAFIVATIGALLFIVVLI
jgi:CHASE3 domain sensor protein